MLPGQVHVSKEGDLICPVAMEGDEMIVAGSRWNKCLAADFIVEISRKKINVYIKIGRLTIV